MLQWLYRNFESICDLHVLLVSSGCHYSKNRRKRRRSGSWCTRKRAIFCMQQRAVMKKKILMTRTKAKSRARGWHLRIGSGCIFADVQGGGYCYCCGQILLSPVHAWWMNHLAIGQANSHCRCNKQKSSLPHCSLHITQTIRVEGKKKKGGGHWIPPILSFSLLVQKKIISKCLVHV